MKTRFSNTSPIYAMLLLCATLSATAHESIEPHVRVSGVASIEAKPEIMTWHLSIQNRGEDLEEVAAKHQALSLKVLATIKGFNVDEKKISSERMTFGENWEYEQGRRFRNGYLASSQIIFRSGELDRYDTMWKTLAKLPEVRVNNVAFDLLPQTAIDIRNQAREQALLSAREKAGRMAETLGSRIGLPIVIEDLSGELDHFHPQAKVASTRAMSLEMADGGGPSVNPGMIEISARVQVSFELAEP